MHSSREKLIAVVVTLAMVMILCVTCMGAQQPEKADDDWNYWDNTNFLYPADLGDAVGIGKSDPNAKLHVLDDLTDANHPSILIEKSSTTSLTPRLGMVDTNYLNTGTPEPVGACPIWCIDNFRDQFRIYRQPDKSTQGPPNQSLLIDNLFNVGIGTDTPETKLDVAGTVQMTGFKMPTDASDGYVLTSNVDGVGTWQPAGDGSADGCWQCPNAPSGPVYTLLGDVGIGTDTPGYLLSVDGTGNDYYLSLSEDEPGGADGFEFQIAPGGGGSTSRIGYFRGNFGDSDKGFYIYNERNAPITFGTNDNERMRITGDGKVGIGTTTPQSGATLDVRGTICVKDPDYCLSGIGISSNGQIVVATPADTIPEFALRRGGYHRWLMRNYDSDNRFAITQLYNAENSAVTEDRLVISDSGNVGIGTTSPACKLDVIGNICKTGNVAFVEEHPQDPTKEIVYACLEGPETGTYIRGTAQLVNGEAVINLAEHFSLVTSDEGLTVQLTPVGEWLQLYVVEKGTQRLVVREANGKDGQFDYLVQGVRIGYEDYQVIRDKE